MTKNFDYTQRSKKDVRHLSLYHAVQLLTTKRQNACCVERSYVRNVYDYFKSTAYDKSLAEVNGIDIGYITAWERLHDSCVSYKRPEDLSVCYLSGPQPANDFNELTSLGILPQNIWAFENDKGAYQQALSTYNSSDFPQPQILKMSIQQFFKDTPKKFDIVYIDACGTIISDQKCLQIIATLFRYHRLNPLGVLVTNFSSPDISSEDELNSYSGVIALYSMLKLHPNTCIDSVSSAVSNERFVYSKNECELNFSYSYGEFITSILKDVASIIVPAQRFSNAYAQGFIKSDSIAAIRSPVSFDNLNKISNHSVSKFFMLGELMERDSQNITKLIKKLSKFSDECTGFQKLPINIAKSLRLIHTLKDGDIDLEDDVASIKDFFDNDNNIYQFLDKTTSAMFFDLAINQLSYPMHYNSESIKRFTYTAKAREMHMDVIAFDECRYIYEWLPSIHQVQNAFLNKSWQYVFRFALDGLVKQRISYNNEYFFQGSVVPQKALGFSAKFQTPRIIIN